jgi:hypothetical protein
MAQETRGAAWGELVHGRQAAECSENLAAELTDSATASGDERARTANQGRDVSR